MSSGAGVAELADAGDSKSPGPCGLAGSIPAPGTTLFSTLRAVSPGYAAAAICAPTSLVDYREFNDLIPSELLTTAFDYASKAASDQSTETVLRIYV